MALGAKTDAVGRTDGYTIVEVLIAATLLLVISLGILPLFTRAAISNKQGDDSTEVANLNRATVEEFAQLAFNSPALTVDAGVEKVVQQKFLVHSERWVDLAAPDTPADPAIWYRTTTVRQYGWDAVQSVPLDPELLTVDPALERPAGSPSADIVLKEIIVEIERPQKTSIFGAPELSLRVFKTH